MDRSNLEEKLSLQMLKLFLIFKLHSGRYIVSKVKTAFKKIEAFDSFYDSLFR